MAIAFQTIANAIRMGQPPRVLKSLLVQFDQQNAAWINAQAQGATAATPYTLWLVGRNGAFPIMTGGFSLIGLVSGGNQGSFSDVMRFLESASTALSQKDGSILALGPAGGQPMYFPGV